MIVPYLEELSKKARDAQATRGGTLTIHAIPYRVEGARDRFVFRTYVLQENRLTVSNTVLAPIHFVITATNPAAMRCPEFPGYPVALVRRKTKVDPIVKT